MKKEDYSEKLKDQRWIALRDEILVRDGNSCQICGATNNLHVHHKYYLNDKDPWEYPYQALITLCGLCHKVQHSVGTEDVFKQRVSNMTNDYMFAFTKSVMELHPLFIVRFNSLPLPEKKMFLRFFNVVLKYHNSKRAPLLLHDFEEIFGAEVMAFEQTMPPVKREEGYFGGIADDAESFTRRRNF